MSIFHAACKTLDHQLAFSSWEEGLELFDRLADTLGDDLVSLSVMPEHIHPLTARPMRDEIRAALSGYTRWRNHRTGRTGPLFAGVPEPLERTGKQKILRDQRYVELNACRAGLVTDPLAWPLSTWRDRMGLAWRPVRPRAHDVARWHAYAVRDDYVAAGDLPYLVGPREVVAVEEAVSAVTRCVPGRLRLRGPARTLLIASLRQLTSQSAVAIGQLIGVSTPTVRRIDPREVAGVDLVARVAGDPRFRGLGGPLPDFSRYLAQQRRNAMGPEWWWE